MRTHEVKISDPNPPCATNPAHQHATQGQTLHTHTLFSPQRALATYVLPTAQAPVRAPFQ